MDNRIYISGPITGLTRPQYLAKFGKAHQELEMQGFVVFNPASVNDNMPHGTTWDEYMEMSMCMLKMCRRIYMLKGWEDSRGATHEHYYALHNNYEIIYEEVK